MTPIDVFTKGMAKQLEKLNAIEKEDNMFEEINARVTRATRFAMHQVVD